MGIKNYYYKKCLQIKLLFFAIATTKTTTIRTARTKMDNPGNVPALQLFAMEPHSHCSQCWWMCLICCFCGKTNKLFFFFAFFIFICTWHVHRPQFCFIKHAIGVNQIVCKRTQRDINYMWYDFSCISIITYHVLLPTLPSHCLNKPPMNATLTIHLFNFINFLLGCHLKVYSCHNFGL